MSFRKWMSVITILALVVFLALSKTDMFWMKQLCLFTAIGATLLRIASENDNG